MPKRFKIQQHVATTLGTTVAPHQARHRAVAPQSFETTCKTKDAKMCPPKILGAFSIA